MERILQNDEQPKQQRSGSRERLCPSAVVQGAIGQRAAGQSALSTTERLERTITIQQKALETLFAISGLVSAPLDFKQLVLKILELVLPVVDARNGIFWALHPDKIGRCRENLTCTKTTCPAYHNVDHRCWSIFKTECFHRDTSRATNFEEKLVECMECTVLAETALTAEACIGHEEEPYEEEMAVSNPLCKKLLLRRPSISVYHSFPSNDGVEAYEQTVWLNQDAHGDPHLVEDAGCIAAYPDMIPNTRIGLGLVTKNQIIGVICLDLKRLHYLSESEVSLLTNIARIAAVTIENAHLSFIMEKRSQKMTCLCKEAHHRIKNNLQSLAGLCFLQMQYSESPTTKGILMDNMMRIRSISFVHQLLSQDDTASVNLLELADKILETAVQITNVEKMMISFAAEGDSLCIDSKRATNIAIILNELVTNSLKHGFRNKLFGRLRFSIRREPGMYALMEFSDNGEGFPGGFDIHKSANIGLKIVNDMVKEDLNGSMQMSSAEGAQVRIRFRL